MAKAPSFEEKLATEEQLGRAARLDDAPPIGARADGTIECYAPGKVPPYEPEVISGDEPEDDDVEEDGEDLGDV